MFGIQNLARSFILNQKVNALCRCRRILPNLGEFRDGTDAIKDQEIKDQDSLAEDSGLIFKPKFKGQDQGSKVRSRINKQGSRIQRKNRGSKFPL